MPLYERRNNRDAKTRKEDAVRLEEERRKKRIEIKRTRSEEMAEALKAMAKIHTVRIGKEVPSEDPGKDYGKPIYDKKKRCWLSHIDGVTVPGGDLEWKIWCLESSSWQTKGDWERAHPDEKFDSPSSIGSTSTTSSTQSSLPDEVTPGTKGAKNNWRRVLTLTNLVTQFKDKRTPNSPQSPAKVVEAAPSEEKTVTESVESKRPSIETAVRSIQAEAKNIETLIKNIENTAETINTTAKNEETKTV